MGQCRSAITQNTCDFMNTLHLMVKTTESVSGEWWFRGGFYAKLNQGSPTFAEAVNGINDALFKMLTGRKNEVHWVDKI